MSDTPFKRKRFEEQVMPIIKEAVQQAVSAMPGASGQAASIAAAALGQGGGAGLGGTPGFAGLLTNTFAANAGQTKGLTPFHQQLQEMAGKFLPSERVEWTTADAIRWKVGNPQLVHDIKRRWVTAYKDAINAAANRFQIPPVMLAGVAYNEVGGDPMWFDDAADAVRTFDHAGDPLLEPLTITKNPDLTSYGNVSMQVRRAAETLGYNANALDSTQRNAIIASLKDPQTNIFIAAAHLGQLHTVDYSGQGSGDWTNEEIAVTSTRYNRGPELPLERIKQDMSYGQAILNRRDALQQMISPSL